ncbi:hypothetical protein [Actinopolymorpha pittospori]|uniref:ATP-dependent DNA ligase n=1 Tax=Actinopolymorpha pittospori TaxID=648752 RepID=UPI0030801B3F
MFGSEPLTDLSTDRGAASLVRYARRHHARELTVTEPAHLAVFDVLETAQDGDLRRRPPQDRRGVLERMFRRVPPRSPLTPRHAAAAPDVAQEWYEEKAVAGIEGLMIKPANGPHPPGCG